MQHLQRCWMLVRPRVHWWAQCCWPHLVTRRTEARTPPDPQASLRAVSGEQQAGAPNVRRCVCCCWDTRGQLQTTHPHEGKGIQSRERGKGGCEGDLQYCRRAWLQCASVCGRHSIGKEYPCPCPSHSPHLSSISPLSTSWACTHAPHSPQPIAPQPTPSPYLTSSCRRGRQCSILCRGRIGCRGGGCSLPGAGRTAGARAATPTGCSCSGDRGSQRVGQGFGRVYHLTRIQATCTRK
jgi:hypothetical protein